MRPDHDTIRRALLAPHDHPAWSRLRTELLAAVCGIPLPEPVYEPLTKLGGRSTLPRGQVRPAVLAALRKGPVHVADWPIYAGSAQSLRGVVDDLRKAGYRINCANKVFTLLP